jgi:DNA-directed RNA polymerase subunit beta'
MRTTVGQLMLNEALPPELRDHRRELNGKSIRALMRLVADKYPDRYREITQRLHEIGMEAATTHGGVASLSLDAFKPGKETTKLRKALGRKVEGILANTNLTSEQKDQEIIRTVGNDMDALQETNYQEALAARNPFAVQVASGARGNKAQLKALTVGDLLVSDHRGEPIPVPLTNSYSTGLDPVQYWAGAYGARKGEVDKKFATPKAGFLSKQLAMAGHRLIVTEEDCGTTNGIPVRGNDPDNEGTVLAQGHGNVEAGSLITPKRARKLKRLETVIVRSPMTCQARNGICQKCAGQRERGGFPPIGDNIGIAAAQAVAEPLTQAQISSKHTGGVFGGEADAIGGFDLINQLVQVPKTFTGSAAISTLDGRVASIDNAPQGGKFVVVNDVQHWVPPDKELSVKAGDLVEAGDSLSSGIPNPAELAKHKGVGAGRWHFMRIFHNALNDNGVSAHRRNVELLSRGLINHARITELDGPEDTVPGDVVEFDSITRNYKPRYGFKTLTPRRAVGLFLERPALHYSIGTRVTKNVAAELKKHKI